MRAAQAATHPAGTILRCGQCGYTLVATGHEYTAICTGMGRHRATQMRPLVDADSREKRAS